MDYNITLTANHQSLTAKYLPLAAESVQYLTAKVVYETDDWTGREIKAMFEHGRTVYGVTVTGGEITAKQQLNLTAGDWRVWLVGNSARDGDVIPRITTNVAHIIVAPTGGTEGSPFPATPPTVEEQLRADMGNLADLTTEDKSSLVAAINEAAESGGSKDAVTYTPQTLTEEQQEQARTNIGAEKAGTGYTKPASGIPKSDLEQSVQTSLAKADTAIQSQTIPDWNQNDSTQPDYVKNRPFYTGDPVETVLVEESTVSFSFAENEGVYMGELASTFSATVGETYKVSWDGTTYECACVDFSGRTVIGNLSITGGGSDTGEPFLMVVDSGVGVVIGTADTSASHIFSISGVVTEVVKIDPKYIRDMYYAGDPVETVLVEERTVSFSFAENEGLYMAQILPGFAPTVGETYKVYWDGAAYECACVNFNDRLVIGNLSIVGAGSDTGEPFLVGIFNVGRIDIATQNTSASHTVSISRFVQEVVKIDKKYLPNTVATKSEVEAAQARANTAQATADTALATADTALARANTAKTTADTAKTTADAALPKSGGEMSGVIKSSSSIEFPRKYSSHSSPIGGLIISSDITSKVLTNKFRSRGVDSSMFSNIETIVTHLDGITIYNPNKITNMKTVIISAEGEYLDFLSDIGKKPITISAKDIILQSSTAHSTRKFKITVDDSGTLTATEVS